MEAFLALCSQWRVAAGPNGTRPLALDYAAAPAAFDLAGLEVSPETWGQMRIIEQGALAALNGE
jgi:hypothetical protein